jgi:hypothetical protein|tara:strand:+ start:535 stop:729 length:195 start_codon:yes stop_codon:yes gene_type:complete
MNDWEELEEDTVLLDDAVDEIKKWVQRGVGKTPKQRKRVTKLLKLAVNDAGDSLQNLRKIADKI